MSSYRNIHQALPHRRPVCCFLLLQQLALPHRTWIWIYQKELKENDHKKSIITLKTCPFITNFTYNMVH